LPQSRVEGEVPVEVLALQFAAREVFFECIFEGRLKLDFLLSVSERSKA
jgi:hypothetical protein